MRYGCHNLQRNDRDFNPATNTPQTWGGIQNAAFTICPNVQPVPIPPGGASGRIVIPQHVRQLQEDLLTLGFLIKRNPDGIFDMHTEWAVREFQCYAKMNNVARVRANAPANTQQSAHIVAQLGQVTNGNLSVYVDSLETVATAAAQYTGPVSGVVNSSTRNAIEHWLSNNWRCPIIIEAWNVSRGARSTLYSRNGTWAVNLWKHDDCRSTAPRMYYRDFSGHYTLPQNRNANNMHVMGDYAEDLDHTDAAGNPLFYGPRSVPSSHCWSESEITPQTCTGGPIAAPSDLDSIFRIIRACSEVECLGYFDSLNSYDRAFLSQVFCHWTLGIANSAGNGSVDRGELSAFLSYFRDLNPASYSNTFEFFGLRPSHEWANRFNPGGAASTRRRKYACWLSLQNESNGFTDVPLQETEGNYLKTWHWFFRFLMAGRATNTDYVNYRHAMWNMARTRVRDILDTTWGPDPNVSDMFVGTPNQRRPTVGEVFRSEKAVAIMLRWHIYSPGNIIGTNAAGNDGQSGRRLREALARAINRDRTMNAPVNPATLTDANQASLVEGLRQEVAQHANTNLQNTINSVDTWPSWTTPGHNYRNWQLSTNLTPLSENINTIGLDLTGLPAGFP